jgi:hypothetical protein
LACDRVTSRMPSRPFSRSIHKKRHEHMPEFEIALHTAMRPSEQYGLDWSRLDLGPQLPKPANDEKRESAPHTPELWRWPHSRHRRRVRSTEKAPFLLTYGEWRCEGILRR